MSHGLINFVIMEYDIKNVGQIQEKFKDQKTCKKYLEIKRWGGNITCTHCNHPNPYRTARGFTCSSKQCLKKFTVTTGTIMENTKVKLWKWFTAIYLSNTSSKGISSVTMAKMLGVTQKTAWFMLQRIRVMLHFTSFNILSGLVEVDETYVGGKSKNKHFSKRKNETQGRSTKEKIPVVGLVARDGNVIAFATENTNSQTLEQIIENNVTGDSTIITDGYRGYNQIHKQYHHIKVKDGSGFVVRENGEEYHTQTIESFWATLKRGYVGVYHYMSRKHIDKYLAEYSHRFNNRHLKPADKFSNTMNLYHKARITYKQLIGKLAA